MHIGLGDSFVAKILALYTSPHARAKAIGFLSSSFTMEKGVHQGCPLSTLLYVLTMEHLAIA